MCKPNCAKCWFLWKGNIVGTLNCSGSCSSSLLVSGKALNSAQDSSWYSCLGITWGRKPFVVHGHTNHPIVHSVLLGTVFFSCGCHGIESTTGRFCASVTCGYQSIVLHPSVFPVLDSLGVTVHWFLIIQLAGTLIHLLLYLGGHLNVLKWFWCCTVKVTSHPNVSKPSKNAPGNYEGQFEC